jgi:hypothetical protein
MNIDDPESIATAEMCIDAYVKLMVEMIENGIPHDDVIKVAYNRMMEACQKTYSPNEAIEYMSVLLSRAMYHLANLKTHSEN